MSPSLESRRVAVYCGSAGSDELLQLARSVGDQLAHSGIGVVYGGASVGMMGALANGALAAGGDVIGVLPRALTERELAHLSLTELHLVDSMHERKALMARLADGFLALPGGFGTLDELFDVLTHVQIGVSTKRIVLLNIDGYYDHLLAFLDHAQRKGLLQPAHRQALTVETRVDRLEARLFGARGA